MALADDLLPVIDEIRAIPGQLGLRPNRVYLVTATWTGEFTGEQSEIEDAVEIVVGDGQPPKVRALNDEQKALGNLPDGAIEVGPITPSHSSGGFTVAEIAGKNAAGGDTFQLKVVGPAGTTYYRITEVKSDRRLRYMLRAEPVKSVSEE